MQELLDDIFSEEQQLSLKRNRGLIRVMLAQLGFALLSIVLAIYDMVTIVGTGPIGSVIGLIVFGLAYRLGLPVKIKIGLSAPIFSSICFCLIYFLEWSKEEASTPIVALMLLYTIGLSVVIIGELKD